MSRVINRVCPYYVCTKKFVIERTRDLIYLNFVATDFYPKIISPCAGETPVIQCSPSYSAVSALLTNSSPDHSNYSPLLPLPLPHSPKASYLVQLEGSAHRARIRAWKRGYSPPWMDQYFTSLFGPDIYQVATLETDTSLVGNSGETQCLEEAKQ